jgi:hypothetical protein
VACGLTTPQGNEASLPPALRPGHRTSHHHATRNVGAAACRPLTSAGRPTASSTPHFPPPPHVGLPRPCARSPPPPPLALMTTRPPAAAQPLAPSSPLPARAARGVWSAPFTALIRTSPLHHAPERSLPLAAHGFPLNPLIRHTQPPSTARHPPARAAETPAAHARPSCLPRPVLTPRRRFRCRSLAAMGRHKLHTPPNAHPRPP